MVSGDSFSAQFCGLGFRDQGLGFRGLGFRVQGLARVFGGLGFVSGLQAYGRVLRGSWARSWKYSLMLSNWGNGSL